MDFFCLPILCGCSSSISGEGNDSRICPRCNNLSVQPVKKREWFELFCVPIIPFSSNHLWHCSICQWSADRNGSFQPMAPQQFQQQQQHQQQYQQQPYMQPGYGYQQQMGPPPANYAPPPPK